MAKLEADVAVLKALLAEGEGSGERPQLIPPAGNNGRA